MRYAVLLAASLVGATAVVNSQLPTSNSQLPTADCRLPAAGCRLVTRDAYLMGTRAHLATYAASRDEGLATLDAALRVAREH